MFCHKCGEKIPEDIVFCYKCGAQLVAEEKVQEEALEAPSYAGQKAVEYPNAAVSTRSKKKRVPLLSIIAVLILAVALLTAYIIISPDGATDGGYVAATHPETIPAYQDEVVDLYTTSIQYIDTSDWITHTLDNISVDLPPSSQVIRELFIMQYNIQYSNISMHLLFFTGFRHDAIMAGEILYEDLYFRDGGVGMIIESDGFTIFVNGDAALLVRNESILGNEDLIMEIAWTLASAPEAATSNDQSPTIGLWRSIDPFHGEYRYLEFFSDGTGIEEWDGWGFWFEWDMESLVATFFDDSGFYEFYYTIEAGEHALFLIPHDEHGRIRDFIRVE